MAFRFGLDEPLEQGVRRIGAQQIERALAELGGVHQRATAVHDTRKALKRIRALLRLVRPALGEADFRRENERYRVIGELLSGTRDAEVLQETLAKLLARAGNAERKSITVMADAFARRLHDATASQEHVSQAIAELEKGGVAMRALKVGEGRFEPVFAGMEAVYRAGRKAMDEAYAEPGDEAFHEWRKSVQRHWRHMALLSRAWPEAMHARMVLAKELSDVLGYDHDLTVLMARAEGVGTARDRAHLLRAARAAQEELRAGAALLGERLFAIKPGQLRRSLAVYWRSAGELEPRGLWGRADGGSEITQGAGRQAAPAEAAKRDGRK